MLYSSVQVTNPLGSKVGLHKEALFYFSVLNLPPSMSRNMANIHLLAMAKTIDLKTHGIEAILSKVQQELAELEQGFEVFSNGQSIICI